MAKRFVQILGYVLLLFLAVLILYPLLWILISGFKTNREIFTNPFSLPKEWLISNYIKAWEYGVGRHFKNSVLVTVVSTVATVIISALAAFSLTHARFNFSFRKPLMIYIVSGMLLAPQVAVLTLCGLLQKLGIYDTYWAMIVPYIAFRIPFSTFLIRSYFLGLPKELDDSAYIDGCSSLGIFINIYLPLSKPIIATASLLTAMYCWNEFMFPLIFTQSDKLRTIPLGLMSLTGTLRTEWGILIAALILSALPIIILFIVLQKQFVRSLVVGAVKG